MQTTLNRLHIHSKVAGLLGPRMIGLFHQPHHDGFDGPHKNMLHWCHVCRNLNTPQILLRFVWYLHLFRYHGMLKACKPWHAQLLKRNREAIHTSLEALVNKTRLRTMSPPARRILRTLNKNTSPKQNRQSAPPVNKLLASPSLLAMNS